MLLRETHRRCSHVPDGVNPIEWIRYGRHIPNKIQTLTRKGIEMLPEIGTHIARTYDVSVYENEKGTLVFAAHFETAPQTSIVGYQSLTTSDGALNEKAINNLKSVYGWDGLDPFWLAENDLSAIDIEIVVEERPGRDDPNKKFKNVAWINKPGTGGGAREIPQGDKASIVSKYGARFRALSGGSSNGAKSAGRMAPAAKTAPPAKTTPRPPPPPPPSRKAKKVATMQEAWELFCSTADGKIREEDINGEWYGCIKKVTGGKEQHDCDENDWGLIVEEMPEYFNRLTV